MRRSPDVWPLLALIVVCASMLLGQCLAPVPAHSTQAEPAAVPEGGRAVPPAPPADAGTVGRIEATGAASVAATQRPTGRVYALRTTSALPSYLAPVVGALDFRATTVAAGPDHARAWLTAAGWDGAAYEVAVATGPVRVTDLVAALWCSGGTPQVPLVVGPYRSVPRPAQNGAVSLQLAPDSRAAAAPCWAAVSWRVQGRQRVGFLWTAEAPAAPKSTAVVASVASAASGSQAWAEPITSLPYRARLDPLVGLPPAGLQVCYLAGATTIPGPAFAGEVRCPGESRSSVTGAEWRAACRSITAGWGVSEEQRAAVAVACGRWP